MHLLHASNTQCEAIKLGPAPEPQLLKTVCLVHGRPQAHSSTLALRGPSTYEEVIQPSSVVFDNRTGMLHAEFRLQKDQQPALHPEESGPRSLCSSASDEGSSPLS